MTDFTCPECNGTGVYQGLNTVEPCRACGGKKDIKGNLIGNNKRFLGMVGDILRDAESRADACQQFAIPPIGSPYPQSGQSVGKSVIEHAAERTGIKLTDGPVAFDAIWSVFTATYLPEPSKPFDEIMPAEHEELDVGDYVSVEIQCENQLLIFNAVAKHVGRPLFGKPANSFFLESVYPTLSKPDAVFGELLYMPTDNEHLKARVSDPCQDMLFIPILED